MSFLHVITEGDAPEIVCGYHDTADAARACEADYFEDVAQADAELQAERRYERWLEDGGTASERIHAEHIEDELRAL